MNNKALKEAIAHDIETLKTLDVDIMPAQDYYEANGRLFLHVFLKMYGTVLLAILLPCLIHWRYIVSNPILEVLSGLGFLAGLSFGVCAFAFLFIYSALNQYVLINCQLRCKLKTGELMVAKIRQAGTVAYRIFAAITLVPALFLEPGCAVFLAFGAFLISGFLTSTLVEMELNRIGISTLFTLLKTYFDKDKKPAA